MSKRLELIIPAGLIALVILTLTATLAFGQGNPTLRFTEPASGATVGTTVTAKWAVTDVTLVPGASAKAKTDAHLHLFVDKEPSLQDGMPIPLNDPQILHTAATSQELTGLAPGAHKLTLVLGYSDHTPWVPRTVATLNFTVSTTPATMPTTGADWRVLPLLLVGAALVLLGLAARVRRYS